MGKKTFKHTATLATPGHPAGVSPITLSGTGPEVWSLAHTGYRIVQENGAVSAEITFYLDEREVPWEDVVACLELGQFCEVALEGVLRRAGFTEMPF